MYGTRFSEKAPVTATEEPQQPRTHGLNFAYLKTDYGSLKLLQLALGMICVCAMSAHYNYCWYIVDSFGPEEEFFLVMTTTFTLSTLISIMCNLISVPSKKSNAERTHDVIFPGIASFVLGAAGLLLYNRILKNPEIYNAELLIVAFFFCTVDAMVYIFSCCYAFRHL